MDVAAHDDGIGGHAHCTMVQVYTRLENEFTAIYPLDAKSDFPHMLEDLIHDHGAMPLLHSDNTKEETSALVQAILKFYFTKDSQSEAYYQNQNPAEKCIQDVKCMTNAIWLFQPLVVVVHAVCGQLMQLPHQFQRTYSKDSGYR